MSKKDGKVKRKVNHKELLKKSLIRLTIALGIGFGFSWYVSSYLGLLIRARRSVYNPLEFFRLYRFYGFPFRLFLVLGLLFAGFVICAMLKRQKSNHGTKDSERNFAYSDSDVYGSSRLLTGIDGMTDVASIKDPNEAAGIILGQLDTTGKKLITMHDEIRYNNHICVFGSSKSGKSYSVVQPYVLQKIRRRESIVITDPKGELFSTTAEYAKRSGYHVKWLDLKSLYNSHGWDCLKEVTSSPSGTSPAIRAQIFADIVISNTSGGRGITDVHTGGPFMLLMALILRVALDDEYKTSRYGQTMSTVLDLLDDPKGVNALKELFKDENATKKTEVAFTMFNKCVGASDALFGNILTGLNSSLSSLLAPEVREILSRDDIDMTLPAKKPCIYYCVFSDQHKTLNFLIALFFSFMFIDIAEFADSQPTRKCPVPVNFMLDEFANVGEIPDFEKKLATIRSRDMNVSVIIQDINQLRERYPKTWSSILSNCATHLCIGANDPQTAEYFSERSGETTVVVTTEQHEAIEPIINAGNKHSTGDGRRYVLTASEITNMSIDDVIIAIQGHHCMKARKFPIHQHPEFKYMAETNVLLYPSILDTKNRNRIKEEELAFIERYENWMAKPGNLPIPYLKGADIDKMRERYSNRKYIEVNKMISQELMDGLGYFAAIDALSELNNLPGPSITDFIPKDVMEVHDEHKAQVAKEEEKKESIKKFFSFFGKKKANELEKADIIILDENWTSNVSGGRHPNGPDTNYPSFQCSESETSQELYQSAISEMIEELTLEEENNINV